MTKTMFTGTFAIDKRECYAALYNSVRNKGLGLRVPKNKSGKLDPQARPIRCTYAIENRETGSAYVGSTDDFFSRWFKHLNHLKNGNHSCEELQDEFDRYGAERFVIKILTHYTEPVTLRAVEFTDGVRAYSIESLLNSRLGDVWVKRHPGWHNGRVYLPAKSTRARRATVQ